MRLTTPPVAVIERTEGSLPLACETSRCTLVFGGPMRKPDHEAVIRFGGEAPRRGAHLYGDFGVKWDLPCASLISLGSIAPVPRGGTIAMNVSRSRSTMA